MQSEHAHLDMNYSIPERVSLEPHIKQIALKAMEKIPGAKEAIEQTFHKGKWKMPYALPQKKHTNKLMHLGW